MIITDKNRIDDLVKDLFGNISYRHELSEADYRVVSRHSKEIKQHSFSLYGKRRWRLMPAICVLTRRGNSSRKTEHTTRYSLPCSLLL